MSTPPMGMPALDDTDVDWLDAFDEHADEHTDVHAMRRAGQRSSDTPTSPAPDGGVPGNALEGDGRDERAAPAGVEVPEDDIDGGSGEAGDAQALDGPAAAPVEEPSHAMDLATLPPPDPAARIEGIPAPSARPYESSVEDTAVVPVTPTPSPIPPRPLGDDLSSIAMPERRPRSARRPTGVALVAVIALGLLVAGGVTVAHAIAARDAEERLAAATTAWARDSKLLRAADAKLAASCDTDEERTLLGVNDAGTCDRRHTLNGRILAMKPAKDDADAMQDAADTVSKALAATRKVSAATTKSLDKARTEHSRDALSKLVDEARAVLASTTSDDHTRDALDALSKATDTAAGLVADTKGKAADLDKQAAALRTAIDDVNTKAEESRKAAEEQARIQQEQQAQQQQSQSTPRGSTSSGGTKRKRSTSGGSSGSSGRQPTPTPAPAPTPAPQPSTPPRAPQDDTGVNVG